MSDEEGGNYENFSEPVDRLMHTLNLNNNDDEFGSDDEQFSDEFTPPESPATSEYVGEAVGQIQSYPQEDSKYEFGRQTFTFEDTTSQYHSSSSIPNFDTEYHHHENKFEPSNKISEITKTYGMNNSWSQNTASITTMKNPTTSTTTMKNPSTSTTTMKNPSTSTTTMKNPSTSTTTMKGPTTSTLTMKDPKITTFKSDFQQRRASFEKNNYHLDKVAQHPKFGASNRWQANDPNQESNISSRKKEEKSFFPKSEFVNTEQRNDKSIDHESGVVLKKPRDADIYERTYYSDVDMPSLKRKFPNSLQNEFQNNRSKEISFFNKTYVPKLPVLKSKNSSENEALTSYQNKSRTVNNGSRWNNIQRTQNHNSVISSRNDFSNDLLLPKFPSLPLPSLPLLPKPNLFRLNTEPLENESDDEHTYEEVEDLFPFMPESNRNLRPDTNQSNNHAANVGVGGSYSQTGSNNTRPFLSHGIRPNRFELPLNRPAFDTGLIGQPPNSWNNGLPANNWSTNRGPGPITPSSIATNRFTGPVNFRGPRPNIGTTRPPAINHNTDPRMPVSESNRIPANVRPIRPPFGNRPNLPHSSSVGLISHRPPPVDTGVDKPVGSPKIGNRPRYLLGPRSPRPNLFPSGGSFTRPSLDSGENSFPPNVLVNRPPFGQGRGMNANKFSVRGARQPIAPRDDRTNTAPDVPSKEQGNNSEDDLEIYDPLEEEYDQNEEDDDEQVNHTSKEPPELPPPKLPPPVRMPGTFSHPRHPNNQSGSRYPIPNFKLPSKPASVRHPHDNVRPLFSVPNAQQPPMSPTADEVDDQNSHSPIPSRNPASGSHPFSFTRSTKSNQPNYSSSSDVSIPLPSLHNTVPTTQKPVERKTSGERISLPPRKISAVGNETEMDHYGYEQFSNAGGSDSGSSPTWPRNPGVRPLGVPAKTPPRLLPQFNIRPTRVVQPQFPHPTPSQLRGVNRTTVLTLENGESFQSTPFYDSLLKDIFFHLISSKEVSRRLTEDGMFLFQPSSSRKDSNPLTLWLRYNGRNFKFQINKRQDGRYAIGMEKENEDKFPTITEMVEHYYHDPLKHVGQKMYFRFPAPHANNMIHTCTNGGNCFL